MLNLSLKFISKDFSKKKEKSTLSTLNKYTGENNIGLEKFKCVSVNECC